MLRLKVVNLLLFSCGGLNGLAAISVENTLLTIVTAMCGVLTVILSIMLTSYIAHLSDRESHTAPAYPKGTYLVSEVTCMARTNEIKAGVKSVDAKVDAIHSDLKSLFERIK